MKPKSCIGMCGLGAGRLEHAPIVIGAALERGDGIRPM